jgi:hypothetical protein
MKRGRIAAALAAGLAVSAMVAGTPAGAGDEPAPTGTITVDPTSGRPGEPFMFSGEGCVSEAGPGVMEVLVFFGGELVQSEDPAFITVHADGSWGVGMVPNGVVPDEEAGGTWEVDATCFDAETWDVLVDYETATFEVIAPPARPTTNPPAAPPTPAPSTPTTEAPAAPQPAKPAKPVTANPEFTG